MKLKKKYIRLIAFIGALVLLVGTLPITASAYTASNVPNYLFDYRYYADTYPDLKAAFGYNAARLYDHWLNYGCREGRSPSPVYEPKHYRANNPDLKAAFGENWKALYDHFCRCGVNEFRNSSPAYNGKYYRDSYADLRRAFGDNSLQYIIHYMNNGRSENRKANGTSVQTTVSVPSETTRSAYVNTSSKSLNLRASASTSAKVIASMPKGASVTVIGDKVGDFYKVNYKGTIGYASASYIKFTSSSQSASPAPAETTRAAYVNTSSASLNLRASASTSAKVIASMPKGAAITVIGDKIGDFYKVNYKGTIGYASAGYIKFGSAPSSSLVNLITVPSTSGTKLISDSELANALFTYGIAANSNAYKALTMINTKYGDKLASNKSGVNIFFFEGAGSSTSASSRSGALVVVVKNGRIVYLSKNGSTIPDYPFTPSKNGGTDMPTTQSGVYNFTTTNHKSTYAALNITGAKVVRFRSTGSYYESTSGAINIHKRSSSGIAPSNKSWVNSAGCLLVGKYDTNEYLNFIKAVGIVSSGATSVGKKTANVSGKVVIDRSLAGNYLTAIGYTSGAISKIG